ncbi:MAG: glutamine synthetase family protein [Cryobacterium sp.]
MTIPTEGTSHEELEALTLSLEDAGVSLLMGTALDFAGVTRSKGVPIRRLASFHESGMGASPSWVVFCVDNGIAFTSSIGVTGDLRLRLDARAVRTIDAGLAWGPTDFVNQDGTWSTHCARGRLTTLVAEAAAAGLATLMGTELEFTLTTLAGERLPKNGWSAYGMKGVVEHRSFLVDLTDTLEKAGVWPEQIHAEYGVDQFEVSLAPASPVEMADASILTRILIGIVAARHNMAVSFSPLPWADGSGNGAHLHLSLSRDGHALFADGNGPHGITSEGGAAIGGILQALPELLGVYAGSAVSAQRLKPGAWSGASACWGLENREAAVRFLAGTHGNPRGANVELKIVDPSANIYLAAAALLGSALNGIDANLPLPPEVSTNPEDDPRHAELALAVDQSSILDALEGSTLAAKILGHDIVEGLIAVRRHEEKKFAGQSAEEIAQALRFAWSS